ncbi:MAG: TIGR03545 family protein [Gemmatimonadaceae bacterium]
MSTAGSTRSGEAASQYTPPDRDSLGKRAKPRRTKIFRWQGILPIVVVGALVFIGWRLFAELAIRSTLSEAATKALGAQVDIDDLEIGLFGPSVELKGVAMADPFDLAKNKFEVGRLVFDLEALPLLQKRIVVKRFVVADVKTGTVRATPARPVAGGGFAPSALAEVNRFSEQFKVPLLSLVPLDSLKALVLDPSQLRAVQAAIALSSAADSAKGAIEQQYASLRLQETLDSSSALVTRLQGTNVRTLGVDGARRAVADVRRAVARVDSAKARVDGLMSDTRRRVDSLQAGIAAIDAAKREDYDRARGLLKLPSLETPDIGAALFGKVTIDRFEQAVYWSKLARQYAPPGLLPRESEGPKRMRASGRSIHFVTPQSYPRFLLRRADVNVDVGNGDGVAKYTMAVSDVTTDPAIVGRPTLFAIRRSTRGSEVDSLRIFGSMDHLGERSREVVNAQAAGLTLPMLAVPSLPYSIDPGRGSSELRFVLDGDQLTGRWSVRSSNVKWVLDSTRSRRLNTMETLVTRVLTGVKELEVTADISGTLKEPRLAVRSNLDRQVAEQLRSVAGAEIAAAQARVRAQVDRFVDEKSAPVKAKVTEIRAEGERRVADARTKLDAEKRKLEERLKALTAGIAIPGLPGL